MKIFIYIQKVIIAFLYILLFATCSNSEFNKSIIYYENHINQAIVDELKKNNVPFKIDKSGAIMYKSADSFIVNQIVSKIEKTLLKSPPHIYIRGDKLRAMFIELLSNNNIPYKIVKKCCPEEIKIEWPEEFDKKVVQIRKDFLKY